MTYQRYRFSFLLSILIFLILGMGIFSLLEIERKVQAPKKEHLVKVSLLTLPKPVQKNISKPIVPMVVPPIIKKKPKKLHKKVHKKIVKKVIKKHKPKKIHKKIVKKHRTKPKPKKIVKKVIKQHKAKKVYKKSVKKHKPTPQPKQIYEEIVTRYEPEPQPKQIYQETITSYEPEPQPKQIYQETITSYEPEPQPKQIYQEITTNYEPEPQRVIEYSREIPQPIPNIIEETPTIASTPMDNGRAKKTFLQKIRSQIIANKKYPRIALRRHIESSVKVRFDITATGEVSNIRFISGKRIFYKSIKKTLMHTFPVNIPSNMRGKLPIYDISVVLHFNIR